MTEQPPEPTAAGPHGPVATQMPEPTPEPETTPEATDDLAALRREAAGYRRRLREAESERDALREQVDARDRADAERLASKAMASGADLWVAGVELASLRDEDGALDPQRVESAAAEVIKSHPHRKAPPTAGAWL
jgi:hypothetical protein